LHHVLKLDEEIDPYDVTLCNVPKHKRKSGLKILNSVEKREWGKRVIDQFAKISDFENGNFIILAGQEYIKPIINHITNIELPLNRLRQGKRVKFLKSHLPRE